MDCDCKMSIYLAYGMLVYVLGSVLYLLGAVVFGVGTPFKDSLTPEQQKIKKESAKTRSYLFYGGIIISIILMILLKPFKKCVDRF